MSDPSFTLRDVLLPSGDRLPTEPWSTVEAKETLVGLKDQLTRAATGIPWPDASGTIADRALQLLEVGLFEGVLLKVWNEGKLFQKYANPAKYSAEETVHVTLAEHKVKSEHHPRLEILVNDAKIEDIDFEISVEITVNGAIVDIRDGRIWKIRAGDLQCEGELKCEGVILAQTKSKKVSLRGEKVFPEGIPITL